MSKRDGIPDNWIVNAKKEHKKDMYYDVRGNIRVMSECNCVKCLKNRYKEIIIGDPVQVHEGFTVDMLMDRGYVGVYKK